MGRRRPALERVINKLREVEVLLGLGCSVGEASGKIGVAEKEVFENGGAYIWATILSGGQSSPCDRRWYGDW